MLFPIYVNWTTEETIIETHQSISSSILGIRKIDGQRSSDDQPPDDRWLGKGNSGLLSPPVLDRPQRAAKLQGCRKVEEVASRHGLHIS